MANKYYYLIASLPSLEVKTNQQNSEYEDIVSFINDQLSERDRKLFRYLLYPADVKNVVNQMAKSRKVAAVYPFVLQPGSIPLNDLKEPEKNTETYPGFLSAFFEEHRNQLPDLGLREIEKLLVEEFYRSVFQQEDKFLTEYFTFDRDFKNVVTVSYSRKFGFDPKKFLIGDPGENSNPVKNSGEYFFSDEMMNLPKDDSPVNLERVIDRIRWRFVDQLAAFSMFDLYAVFAWFLQFQIRYRWAGEWTEENSSRKFNDLLGHAMEGFNLPLMSNLKTSPK